MTNARILIVDDDPALLEALPEALRLRLAEQLYWSARKMKTAGLRSQHPE